MKTEKEIKEYLERCESAYKEAKKCNQKHLQATGAGVINALRYVLEMEPYDFNK